MGNCCKSMPDGKAVADIKVEGNKCFNVKRMLCCDCDDDTCISSCCVIQNISNTVEKELELKKTI